MVYRLLRVVITPLSAAFELFLLAGNDVEIIVSKLASLLFDLALHFLPVAFHTIPIHRCPPLGASPATGADGLRSCGSDEGCPKRPNPMPGESEMRPVSVHGRRSQPD